MTDAVTKEMILEQLMLMEAKLDRIQCLLDENSVIMDRIDQELERSLAQARSRRIPLPHH